MHACMYGNIIAGVRRSMCFLKVHALCLAHIYRYIYINTCALKQLSCLIAADIMVDASAMQADAGDSDGRVCCLAHNGRTMI